MVALPAHLYRDPAEVVERAEIRALGCSLCRASAITLMRAFCSDPRNGQQRGFPTIGIRCRWYDERQPNEVQP